MATEQTMRNRANKLLAKLPTYHQHIPNGDIDAILTAVGFRELEEGIYCGHEGRIHDKVGETSYLSMTWHKMEVTGHYEIVAYVS